MKVYYDKDANLDIYLKKTIAVIGYGSQGHAHARNLKESGVKVIIGQRNGKSFDQAQKDGFEVFSVTEATKKGDVIVVLLPDEFQKEIYENEIAPHLSSGNSLVFSHGLNIHFQQITPHQEIDVYMVAPKAPGHTVRREYLAGAGVPALIAIHQDPSGQSRSMALAHAKGIGCTKVGVLETTFKEETETDLFGEQVVLCGGLTHLIRAGFETLVEAGYSKEMAYFECLHEVKLITDLIYEGGIGNMHYSISDTAEYGDYVSGPRIIQERTKKEMKKILQEIQNGSFAHHFFQDAKNGKIRMKAQRRLNQQHPIEQVGRKLRQMMSSLFKNKLVK